MIREIVLRCHGAFCLSLTCIQAAPTPKSSWLTNAGAFSVQQLEARNGILHPYYRWPENTLYVISTEFASRHVAIINGATDKINDGRLRALKLQPRSCVHEGTIMHEFMHAIGFFHEQSRADRDKFVEMNWDNIPEPYSFAFDKFEADYVSAFDERYDFGSIMHYDKYAFAINLRVWAIRPKAPYQDDFMGQIEDFSAIDHLKKINAMYPQ